MDVSTPYLVVLSKSEGAALAVLARTNRPLSGREVARLSGGTHNTVALLLRKLAEHGLVNVQEAGAGAALLYTLNRDHLAAGPVLALLNLRQRLFQRLKNELERWPLPPLHASLFGSAARGDGGTSSDIDLFIVRPSEIDVEGQQWRSQVDGIPDLVLSWTGNHVGLVEVSQEETGHLADERPPVVEELERDAVTLLGPSIRQLLGRSSE